MNIKKNKNGNPKHIIPRGPKCIYWLPIIKALLAERTEISTRQRLFTSALAINSAMCFTYNTFGLSHNNNTLFTLKTDDIIYKLIVSLNETVLFKWDGIQNRNKILDTISFDKYLHKSNNYMDQSKNTASDKFCIPIFEKCIEHSIKLSCNQYGYNNRLQNLFQSCLMYSCIYSLLISEVGFFQTTLKPIIMNTALGKNGRIQRYLKKLDRQICIFDWKEEYGNRNINKKEAKICEKVRIKCIKYIENALQKAYQEFYSANGGFGGINNINFNEFKMSVKFNKQKKAKEYPEFDPTPSISSKYFNADFYNKQIDFQQLTSPTSVNNTSEMGNKTNNDYCIHDKRGDININNNGGRRSQIRKFQSVNNYGISHIKFNDRSNMRKHYLEMNIEQRRNDMNIRNGYNYNMEQTVCYCHCNASLIDRRHEHEVLKREKYLLMRELLEMEDNNNDNISRDISMNSNTSGEMEYEITKNNDK